MTTESGGAAFRQDIEGLRGVAVLLVILFHVGVDRLAGGYVGVDVFFVISGFLIAQQLFRETERTGRIALGRFWARRLRRLAPLLFVTVALTLIGVLIVYSPLEWRQLADQAASSTLYVSNVSFARNGQAYFQSATSPFLHTWSLAVEEQFYVGWPLVVVAAALVARRARWSLRRTFTVAVLGLSAISFVAGYALTERGTPWAFYSAPTRAWEFGVGALAFAVGPHTRRLPAVARIGVGWLAMASICYAAIFFDAFTPMPGAAALMPAVGTAVLLVLGIERLDRRSVGTVLAIRPLRSLGRVSYAWYLFHWPAIVLTAAYTNRHDVATAAVAAAVSLGFAYTATHWIERPIRRSHALSSSRLIYGCAAALSCLLLVAAVAVRWDATRQLRDPYLRHLADVRAGRSTSGSNECSNRPLSPDLDACVYGPVDAAQLILLVGDSHAAQWSPAVEAAATELDSRLIVRTYGGCPAVGVFVARTGFDDASSACLDFRAETMRMIQVSRPDVIVLANTDYSGLLLESADGGRLDANETRRAYADARRQFATVIGDIGARLVLIADNPGQSQDPIECLANHRSVERCSVRSGDVVAAVEQSNVAESDDMSAVIPVRVLQTIPFVCDEDRCPVEGDGLVVFADASHLSTEFTLSKTALVAEVIGASLDESPAGG